MSSPASKHLYLILHDIRSAHNVGSMLRTADGLGVTHVYLSGYTPYPIDQSNDARLPHIAQKNHKAIHKTALGAEDSVNWSHHENIESVISQLQQHNIPVIGLEQSTAATPLHSLRPSSDSLALLAGNEVHGISPELQNRCSELAEIPMQGDKESFNVSSAVAMALHWFRYQS